MLTPEIRDNAPPRQDLPYPKGALRALFRSPVVLHRLGLGFLLPTMRLILLTTRGNKSGLPRRTPVEYRMHGTKIYVISGWGIHPHWVKNLLAHPYVTVQAGPRTYSARATVVESPGEALRAIALFRKPAPAVYDAILARMTDSDTVTARELRSLASQVTVVRLDVVGGGENALPAQRVDLVWVWAILAAAIGGLVWLRHARKQATVLARRTE